jgi:hypothetical protein
MKALLYTKDRQYVNGLSLKKIKKQHKLYSRSRLDYTINLH